MTTADKTAGMAEENIINQIYVIRHHRVMIDRDLAGLYGVETKRLKEAVRRNISRFPPDFMFEMNEQEFENWRTQFASSKSDRQGLRYAPYCFTEQGVTMVSCILNTKRAIAVNIRVIRVFSKMRGALMMSKDIFLKLEQLENRMKQQEERPDRQEEDMLAIVEALKQLVGPREHRPVVGFRRPDERRE